MENVITGRSGGGLSTATRGVSAKKGNSLPVTIKRKRRVKGKEEIMPGSLAKHWQGTRREFLAPLSHSNWEKTTNPAKWGNTEVTPPGWEKKWALESRVSKGCKGRTVLETPRKSQVTPNRKKWGEGGVWDRSRNGQG